MGSVGTSGLSTQQPTVTTPAGLDSNADSSTIQKYYKDTYGVDVGGSYWQYKCDPQILVETSKVLDRFASELGKDVMEELGIRIVAAKLSGGTLGQTTLRSGQIAVNSSKFQQLSQLDATMMRDASSHFHPTNSKGADVITHELGHNLEFLINRRINGVNTPSSYIADAQQTYAKAIVQQAYSELKAEQPKMFKTEKQARASVSGYADSKWHGTTAYTETMAEAVADYGRNGANASPMSIKIWQGIKAMLKS